MGYVLWFYVYEVWHWNDVLVDLGDYDLISLDGLLFCFVYCRDALILNDCWFGCFCFELCWLLWLFGLFLAMLCDGWFLIGYSVVVAVWVDYYLFVLRVTFLLAWWLGFIVCGDLLRWYCCSYDLCFVFNWWLWLLGICAYLFWVWIGWCVLILWVCLLCVCVNDYLAF